MALREVLQFPDKRLRLVSEPIETVTEEIRALARDMLDEGDRRIREELAGQPEVQAQMLLVIGQVYRNLGLYEDARDAVEEALTIRLELFGEQHADIAEAYTLLAGVAYYAGQLDSSATLTRGALDIRRAEFGSRDTLVADNLVWLAWVYNEQSNFEAAESLFPLVAHGEALYRKSNRGARLDPCHQHHQRS